MSGLNRRQFLVAGTGIGGSLILGWPALGMAKDGIVDLSDNVRELGFFIQS
jgi:hypothetical protein